MKTTIDFKECLKDSPKFRSAVENAESDIDVLEARLERLVKLCSIMIDTGKSFKKASSDFVVGVRDLANYFHDDNLISNCLNKFAHEMAEMLNYFTTLMDQANRSVCKNLSNFVKKDIRKVKDAQKDFEKASSDLDNAISRNANAPKSKLQECEEAANILTAKKSCFAHTSLDYVFQINILNSKKRFDILETMLSFMHAQSTFFHQGHELFKEFEPEMKSVASQVDELSAKAIKERKEMEERHTLVQEKELIQPVDGDEDIYPMEGYLLKRTSKGFKSWVRRWFTIQNSQLSYMKRSGSREPTIMEDDLRLCTVKPMYEIDRRFCFEVLSPARSHMLQAESDQNMQAWFSNIQQAISQAYRNAERQNSVEEEEESSVSTTAENNVVTTTPQQQTKQPSKEQLRMEKLLAIPGNDKCCDCGNPDPRWSSINLGITLCIECSGIHRSFGVHLSKVRSITLDTWEPELIKVMAELGNDVVNRIYEANLDDSIAAKPSSDGKRSEREAFVRAKYIDKAFVAKLPGPKATSGKKLRGWSVRKKTKRSPTRTLEKDETNDQSDNDLDVTSGIMEDTQATKAVLSVSQNTRNSEVGSVASATDVIVFGTDTELPDFSKSIDLESSEDSCSEDAEDSKSTTSWEDMSKLDPNMLLFKAAQARNLKVMLEALSNKANVNWVNEEEDDKTPLMKAVETGSLAACEFLMLNGAKLDRVDKKGRTPLHHATLHGNTGQVCQFLKRGANLHAKDGAGEDPLTIAINAANADIVTLLRLAKLNEEMKDDGAFGTTSDGTFQDVFRDFSNMASENPEKLKRKDQT